MEKKSLMIGLVFFLMGCQSVYVTEEKFQLISFGDPAEQLVARLGEPYDTRELNHGDLEYHYVERVQTGNNEEALRHYYFVIHNGVVISKRSIEESKGLFNINVR